MNTRFLLWISAALNLALAGALFLGPRPTPPAPLPPTPPTDAQSVDAPAPELPPSPAATAPPAEGFHWSQVASEDLKAYRDNLRAIGCPPATVRDIIMGEINEGFVHQRRALMASLQSRYWEFLPQGEAARRTNWARPMEDLSARRGAMIRDVLGENFTPAEAELQEGRGDAEERLAWLPEEKRGPLRALEEKHEQALQEWTRSVGEKDPTAEDYARWQALQKEFDDACQALLSPEELEQNRLLRSRESLWAAGLSGIEPTEEEWRQVTKLRTDYEAAMDQLSDPALGDEARRERRETLQAELDHGIKEALGDRYAQFEMAQNEDFQAVQKVTQRYGLAESVAAQAYQIQQAALAEAARLRSDPNLSAEDRQAALTAVDQETEHALATTLGSKALATYKEYGGGWLKELGQ